MICLRCDGEDFEERVQKQEQEYRGLTVIVEGPAMTCKKCGWWTYSLEQLDHLVKATKREYLNSKAKN